MTETLVATKLIKYNKSLDKGQINSEHLKRVKLAYYKRLNFDNIIFSLKQN